MRAAASLVRDPEDPQYLASTFLTGCEWRYWQDGFYRYDCTQYTEVPEYEFKATLTKHIRKELNAAARKGQGDRAKKRKKPRFSGALLSNTLQCVKDEALLPGTTPMSSLVGGDRRQLIPLANGLLDPVARDLLEHTPEYFSTTCLPYGYVPKAECPKFLAALNRICEGDSERIALLQEWFGYNLVMTTDAQKFLILHGDGRNGKSVICAALEALLGTPNVSSVPLGAFGERFGLLPTVGKLANIHADLSHLSKFDEGKLKQFVSGDLMTFDRKGREQISVRPTARLTFATNSLPRISDTSKGLIRRVIFFPCTATISLPETVRGMDKASYWEGLGELPGMLNWALEGLDRLRRNNWTFTEPEVCRRAGEDHQMDCHPARRFLEERYEAGTDEEYVRWDDLSKAYKEWCEAEGEKPHSAVPFGKEIPQVFPSARLGRTPGKADRGRCRYGIRPRRESD